MMWNDDDQRAFDLVEAAASRDLDDRIPVIIFVNKVDMLEKKGRLLPFLEKLPQSENCKAVLPGSAKDGTAVDDLESIVFGLLPEGPFQFGEDDLLFNTYNTISSLWNGFKHHQLINR